jgi:hypothetical protein
VPAPVDFNAVSLLPRLVAAFRLVFALTLSDHRLKIGMATRKQRCRDSGCHHNLTGFALSSRHGAGRDGGRTPNRCFSVIRRRRFIAR